MVDYGAGASLGEHLLQFFTRNYPTFRSPRDSAWTRLSLRNSPSDKGGWEKRKDKWFPLCDINTWQHSWGVSSRTGAHPGLWRTSHAAHLWSNIVRRFAVGPEDRKSTRLNSSHSQISYAVFCLKKKKLKQNPNLLYRYTYTDS